MSLLYTQLFGANLVPGVIKARYALQLGANDVVSVRGKMNIEGSFLYRCCYYFMKIFGKKLLPIGKDIPVGVHLRSNETANEMTFERVFHYPGFEYPLFSTVIVLKNNQVVEMLSKRIGCKLRYTLEEDKVVIVYAGYQLKVGKHFIPLPLSWLLGKPYTSEQALSDNEFYLKMAVKHVFGTFISYEGKFTVLSVTSLPNVDENVPSRAA